MKIISQAFIFLWLQLFISNSIASDVEYTLAKIPDFSLGKSYEHSSGKSISHSPVIIFDVFADEHLYILVTNNKKSEQPYAQLDWNSVKITHSVFGDVTFDLLYNMGQESDEVNTDDEIYINHSPFNTKYISQIPYVFEFKVDFCASVDARNDCIEPKKLKSKFQFYILSTADVAEFSPPDLTLDMLFYIDKDGEPRISGYEFLNETIELVNYLSSDNFDELKESAKGATNTLEDLIPGIGNLISNDLKAPADLKDQVEFKKDVGNFAFLASRRVDELTQREIDQARDLLSKYEDEIDNIKDNLPPTHIPSEETVCKGNDACQVYIAVNGRFNLSAEFYGDYQSKKQKGVKENSALLSIRSIDEENPVATDITVTIGANTKFEDKFNTPKFQLFKKNFIQFVPTPVGIPIVFTENLGIYAEIEVEGGLEASSEVAIRFEREDLFMAGVGWKSNKVDINGELCGEEASANKNIIIYKCRNDLNSAITIQGNVDGEANVKATMRIYPEVEFMVYRNAGATVSLEPGIYADASIYGKASFEKELDVIGGDNPDTDSVLAFNSLELGVNGRAGFRADFGVILSDETIGVTYPVCAGVCARTKRDYINLGEYQLYNLPSTNFLSYVGFLGGSSVIKADFKEGVNFFSDNGNPVKGYQFQLIDPAGDVLATDTTEVVSDSPITQVIQDIDILDEDLLEAGSEYKVRLYYWSALGKYISKAEEISIFYSPPTGELNTQVITQQEGYAQVSWDAISQATDYWIYRDGVIIATFTAGQTSYEYIDSTVQSGQSYKYQVVPVSGNGVNFKQPVISFPEALSFSIEGAATTIVDQDYLIALKLTNDAVCVKSFEIDWGDSSPLLQGSAVADDCLINTALNFSHQYSYVGTYQIIAELTDDKGEKALAYHTVQVIEPTPTGTLNDTGITWGGNYPDGNNSTCTSNIDAPQDCNQGRDALAAAGSLSKIGGGNAGFDFTRINSDGSEHTGSGDYATAPWSCVRDNVTGLIWEVKDPSNGTVGDSLHDADDSYNWYNTDSSTNGGSVGYADDDGAICYGYENADSTTYCNTEAFGNRVNAAGLCGATDWRLPKKEELRSIVDYGRYNPSIDSDYFPNAVNTLYWSGSPDANNSLVSWSVSFGSGGAGSLGRFRYSHVRLVRSAP